MSQPSKVIRNVIAVDIDDVIAAHAPAFVEYSNNIYGTSLTIDDYHDHWGRVWKVDHEEYEIRADEYHRSGYITTYGVVDGAYEVLNKLKSNYSLVILSARRQSVNQFTYDWVEKYFPSIFDDIIFAGFFDKTSNKSWKMTKASHAKKIRAEYLIDDQLKHCEAAAKQGIKSLLFGNYPWNQSNSLPSNVKRIKNWQEVLEYFTDNN